MVSWAYIVVLILAEVSVVAVLACLATRHWLHAVLILGLGIVLTKPLARSVTGDVSRYLPAFLWSGGPDGKDQIILASAASTVALALAAAALSVVLIRRLSFALRRG